MGRTEPSSGGSKELQFFLVSLSPTQCVKTQISSVISSSFTKASLRLELHQLHLIALTSEQNALHTRPSLSPSSKAQSKPNSIQLPPNPTTHTKYLLYLFPSRTTTTPSFPTQPTHSPTTQMSATPTRNQKTKSRYRTSHLRTPPPQSSPHAPSSSKATRRISKSPHCYLTRLRPVFRRDAP